MISPELQKKIDRATKLIRTAGGGNIVEVAFSGGKDSEVILQLAKEAGINYRAIYKNTTCDPIGTIAHCKSKGCEIRNPEKTFLQLIKEKGMPSRRMRFCCDYLKEYKILDISIQGIRRSESTRRAKQYSADDPIICRVYKGGKSNHVSVILPILEWTNEDVADFISDRGIKCHPLYYNEDGSFDVTKRLGCYVCPLQSKKSLIARYRNNPKWVACVIRALKVYFKNKPNAKWVLTKKTPYDYFACVVLCDNEEEYINLKLQHSDIKLYLEEYFSTKLP